MRLAIAGTLAIWAGIILANLAIIGAVVYVAVHFLLKLW